MDLLINRNDPMVMHIDLNSAFASIEQQAHPHLRGRPIVVAAYPTPNACVVAPSIEAKKIGIKTGFRVREARLLCPDVVVLTPDPQKYRDFHLKFRRLLSDYSPLAIPKSIDEVVIDFKPMANLKPDLIRIANEIKQRIKTEIGDWLKVSIGIGTNRFLAKTGAGLHKPDGLDVITHKNIISIYNSIKLIDICGINTRFQARLNAEGIYTPIDFFSADLETLKKKVFKSILGYYWYLRLRGYEIDDVISPTKSIGQDYALYKPTTDRKDLGRLIIKLTEKMGRRLRHKEYFAYGVHLSLIYKDWTWWHMSKKFDTQLFTTKELYTKMMLLFDKQPVVKPVSKIGVSCYELYPSVNNQISLFGEDKGLRIQRAMDKINDKHGEYTVSTGSMINMDDLVLDRIAFGGVKELEQIYSA